MSKRLGSLPVGAKIRDPKSKYNGVYLDTIILGHNHDGSGITSVLTEKIITLKCFDAMEPQNSDSNRKQYGNNRYKHSNLLSWLNSEGGAGNWYVAKHAQDAPPTNGNVYSNYNEYDQEAGFLTNISADLRAAMVAVEKTVALNTVTDGGKSEKVTAKVHLLANVEVGFAEEVASYPEGRIYDYFAANNTNTQRIAKPTAQAVSKSEYTNASLNANSGWYWWLRTPHASSSRYARYVNSDGSLNNSSAYNGFSGVRPAWFLSSDLLVSDNPNSEGAYEIQWNAAPQITTDQTALGDKNKAFQIKFSVTDPDGDPMSGSVDIDGTQTIQTFDSFVSGQEYTIDITAQRLAGLSVSSHNINIIARDNQGNQTKKTITFNRIVMAPAIDTPTRSLGNQNKRFEITFKVTDEDSENVNAVVTLDEGTILKEYKPVELGAQNTVEITSQRLSRLDLGEHTIKIKATDPEGNEEEVSITFNKIVVAPVITVPEYDLGEKNRSFQVKFTVTDEDSDSARAVVKIDNEITIATIDPVTLGREMTVTVTNPQIVALNVGEHTINITAYDPEENEDTAEIRFTRAASTVIISGEDEELGQIWKKPFITYQVTDTADQKITSVKEYINDDMIREMTSIMPGRDIDFDLSSWASLEDEKGYTLKIVAENAIGMISERTYSFRKLYNSLILQSEVVHTDIAARAITVNLLHEGGSVTVEACNNGFDDDPAWEDMTDEFLSGKAHDFENEDKTAEEWGIRVRITIEKGDTERVYLKSYSFSFV